MGDIQYLRKEVKALKGKLARQAREISSVGGRMLKQGNRYGITLLDHCSHLVKFTCLKNKTSQSLVAPVEKYLAACQAALNVAVQQFFGRHVPRRIGAPLPSVDGEAEGMAVAHKVTQQSHLTLTRWSRENRQQEERLLGLHEVSRVKEDAEEPSPPRTRRLLAVCVQC